MPSRSRRKSGATAERTSSDLALAAGHGPEANTFTVISVAYTDKGGPGGIVPLDGDMTFAAFIPVGRTFDPDTNEGWEGTGVKPHVEVPADKALDEALRLAGVPGGSEAALAQLD